MTDAPVPMPNDTPEPSPELVKELEEALACGNVDDLQVVRLSHGLWAVWDAIGLTDLWAYWWPQQRARRAELLGLVGDLEDVEDGHPAVVQYCDWLRDWTKQAGDATSYRLDELGIPYVRVWYQEAGGTWLQIQVPAKARP